ncbi:DUF3027 domain-containing protein [Actinomycetaceae bacterium TAE3-ERU4]|nr:DUF3027 domain-containing protein [Actinomycetaceae bacterium TAE3-ERU4]
MPKDLEEKKNSKQGGVRRDSTLAKAVDIAREAACELAREGHVGNYLGYELDAPLLLTHLFECLHPGYVGWVWAVTVTRVPRARKVTVCEVEMLPHEGALLAPQWVPWDQRLLSSDVSRGEMVPYPGKDDCLASDREHLEENDSLSPRPRMLSEKGLRDAKERWQRNIRSAKPNRHYQHSRNTFGFMIPLSGPLGAHFGICANEFCAEDGHLVSITHSCGTRSETKLERVESPWEIEPLRLNDMTMEVLNPADFWAGE